MKITENNFNVLLNIYEPLLYYCIHKLNISSRHNDFEDCYQIACIALISAYERSEINALSNQASDRYQFTNYAKRQITWKLRDYLRKLYRNADHEILVETDEELDYQQDLSAVWLFDLRKQLKEDENKLLTLLLRDELTHKERAQRLKISRKTYYKRRKKLAERVREIWQIEKIR